MRLLICTQAVDLDDPVLAFFHPWIEEFAKNCESIHVICLKEGRHTLPENVFVHSLGKEGGRSLFKYISRFYRFAWTLRREYDAVFAHMNPEYLVLGGLLWRALGKRAGLWYIHPKSSLRLRFAAFFATHIFSASEGSFPFATSKLIASGHGIDTGFFSPSDFAPSETLQIMHVGRVAPVKHLECILDALVELSRRGVAFAFDQYGEELPRDAAYAAAMRERARLIPKAVFHGKASAEELREAYRSHDVHVNATTSGSFDKAVLESMACGTITLASSDAFRGILPEDLMFRAEDPVSLADALERVSRMFGEDRDALRKNMRATAEKNSLPSLISTISRELS